MNYCLLGKANKCYPECSKKCNSSSTFFLKDRMEFLFRVIPDNIETVTTVYNSKITSIPAFECGCNSARIDILDETIEDINLIISKALSCEKLEGKNYTNGYYNKDEQ
jgi:hypothetical protein